MSRLILPGQAQRSGGLTILVPRGHESADPPKPVGECVLCDVEFYDETAARRHFERNARKHVALAEEALTERLARRMPIFDEESWDPEVAAYMRKVGERMIRERRLVVKPSERAGF